MGSEGFAMLSSQTYIQVFYSNQLRHCNGLGVHEISSFEFICAGEPLHCQFSEGLALGQNRGPKLTCYRSRAAKLVEFLHLLPLSIRETTPHRRGLMPRTSTLGHGTFPKKYLS